MTRQEAIDRLCTVYQSQFDINRCEEDDQPLAVTMDFYATSEKFVLSKKAKLWEAKSFEYVYLFNVPHLTREIYEAARSWLTSRAWPVFNPAPPICTPTSRRCLCVTAVMRRRGRR